MKLLSLLFYVKILALVACLCVADQSSRGLRDDQKTELSSISAVTTSVLPEATSHTANENCLFLTFLGAILLVIS